jgi:cytochrome oxidase assembly protein ShyY1
MLEIAIPNYTDDDHNAIFEREEGMEHPSNQQPHDLLPFATLVQLNNDGDDEMKQNDTNTAKTVTDTTTATTTTPTWPVAAHVDTVGDFKVSPTIHVGYAITWYGLSMAGLYMTRLLRLRR